MLSEAVRNTFISMTSPYLATETNRQSVKTMRIVVILFAVAFLSPVMGQSKKWDALMAAGNSLFEKGQLTDAEKAYREALPVAEKFGNKDARPAGTLIKLALVCEAQSKHDEAYILAKRALMVLSSATNSYKNLKFTNLSEGEHYKVETTVMILNHAVDIYSAQKKYNEAEPLLMVVVTIREGVARKTKAKSNEDFLAFMVQAMTGASDKLLESYENLAKLYSLQGKNAEAEALYIRALTYLGENSNETVRTSEARIHNRLGELFFKQGKYSEAEASVENALKIYQTGKITSDPYRAIALSNLATLYVMQEKYYDVARSYFQAALDIFQKASWTDKPDVADTLENYATLLRKLGNEAEAVEMSNRAKVIRDQRSRSIQNQ